jgi:3-oxoadipate enol-lactonase
MKTLKTAEGPLAYDVAGEGPAVLLLHAFPLDLTMWDGEALALQPTHSVIRFDCRGFGSSPPGEGLLTMERIADDAAALLDHLGVGRAVVCGMSMGGYAAFAMARRHGDRLKALVLADTRSGPDTSEGRQARAVLAEKVGREGAAAAAEAFLPKLLGETTHRERPEVVARVRETILRASPRGIMNALAGLAARGDSTPTLREIRVPALVVCGVEDTLTPVSEATALNQGMPASRLEVLAGAGHLSNLETPAAFQGVLLTFLGGLAGP